MGHGRHLVCWLYRGLMEHLHIPLRPLRQKWETVFLRDLDYREWVLMVEHPRKVSSYCRLKVIQLFILHHAYLTPKALQKMYNTASSSCPRCPTQEADFIHMVWSCPVLRGYWMEVTLELYTLAERAPWDAIEACLLGLFPLPKKSKLLCGLSPHDRKKIDYTTLEIPYTAVGG